MKKTKFAETQIVSILKQQEAGIPTKEICRLASFFSFELGVKLENTVPLTTPFRGRLVHPHFWW
jgi:putative transposase